VKACEACLISEYVYDLARRCRVPLIGPFGYGVARTSARASLIFHFYVSECTNIRSQSQTNHASRSTDDENALRKAFGRSAASRQMEPRPGGRLACSRSAAPPRLERKMAWACTL
jgi:hypothetical protein